MAAKKPAPFGPPPLAYAPPLHEIADTAAIQALAAGEATPAQQRRALRWIVEAAGGAYDLSYRPGPGGDRDTAFHEGRRFVATQIVKLTKLNLAAMKKATNG